MYVYIYIYTHTEYSLYVYMYVYIYIYMFIFMAPSAASAGRGHRSAAEKREQVRHLCVCLHEGGTPDLPTNIVDFRGFDSSMILMPRGGIPSQAMLVGKLLVGSSGVDTYELFLYEGFCMRG